MLRVVGANGAKLERRQQLQSLWRSHLVEIVTLWATQCSCISIIASGLPGKVYISLTIDSMSKHLLDFWKIVQPRLDTDLASEEQ